MMIHMTLSSTFDYVCVTHEEALSSFDRNGCASDHPEFVEAVTGIGDAIVRHEGTSHRENTCETRFTSNWNEPLSLRNH